MSSRSKARKFAMQLVYQACSGKNTSQWQTKIDLFDERLVRLLHEFWEGVGEKVDDESRRFAEERLRGVLQALPNIDQIIDKHALHWRMDRMASVDLSILRLAVYELKYASLPPSIVINEAVNLAKAFSTAEASSFINGILDGIAHDGTMPVKTDGRAQFTPG